MRSLRNLIGASLIVLLLGALTAVMARQDRHVGATVAPSGASGHIVLLSNGDANVPADVAAELASAGARQVSTFNELETKIAVDDLLVIDVSAFNDVPADYLAAQVHAGRPILGLNISASELGAKSGFLSQSAQVQPLWGQESLGSKPSRPFFTVLMLKHVDYTWQRVVAQPLFSDGLFRSYLNQARLAAQGLTYIPTDSGGKVVPLSDLGGTAAAQ